MKKVLLLSYYFPPLGMGGVQRPAKFAKYLPEFGWQPTVLTVKPLAYWAEDSTALSELADIRIVRTESFDPQRLLTRLRGAQTINHTASVNHNRGLMGKLNEKIVPYFLIPDSKILWRWHALRAARKLLKEERFDAIFTTSPPHSVHLIGKTLAKKFGLQWVGDFRDDWAGGVVVHERTRLHKWLNRVLQNSVLRSADAVVAVSGGIRDKLKNSIPDPQQKFFLIYNGFDAADYPKRTREKDETRFFFCHCGSITKFSNPESFLQGLQLFKQKHPQLAERLLVQFVGYDVTADFPKRVRQAGVEDLVTYHGYQPHRKALQYLVNADALLLIAKGKEGATFIPGKVFEYLGARKPILALSNVADTTEVLGNSELSVVLDWDDVAGIADEIACFMQKDRKLATTQSTIIEQFGRKRQTQQLASILDALQETSKQ